MAGTNIELTDASYWDRIWHNRVVPRPMNPHDSSLNNFANARWHEYFQEVFCKVGLTPSGNNRSLLEVGCGGSILLPYFRSEFGFEVAGLDYSEVGCDLSRAIHAAANIPADIRQGDMFDPPVDWLEAFDVVYSRGLVEHFSSTAAAVRALARLCRPGGYLITEIPNMAGFLGSLQKFANRQIYERHVPLTATELAEAHSESGLLVQDCRYILTVNFSAVNFSGQDSRVPEWLGLRLAAWSTKLIWTLQKMGLPETPTRTMSPYIVCLAQKPFS